MDSRAIGWNRYTFGMLVIYKSFCYIQKSRKAAYYGIVWALFLFPQAATAGSINAQSSVASDPMLLHQSGALSIRAHLQSGVNAVAEKNLFWDLASLVAGNSDFDADTEWLELFLEPGISFETKLNPDSSIYGKISGVASFTAGTDAFDARNTGRTTLEEAYLGYRKQLSSDLALDVSVGARSLKLGTGMLITNGGGDGFERGALKFGPREAWSNAGIVKLNYQSYQFTGFYIDANEMASNDTENQLAGIDLRWNGQHGTYAGLTYLRVLNSQAPYPQAATGGAGPPNFLPGAREDLNALNFYASGKPFSDVFGDTLFSVDLAYQWNENIDLEAWAARIKAEYTFKNCKWKPVLGYSYQIFTGDDPNTNRLERFDPLYYDGSPSAWATGSKSAMVFINSNVQSHNLSLRMTPTPRDIVTFRYAHVRAHELRSPVQFGQATRVQFADDLSTVVTGVTDEHLSDDFFIEYTRIINPNTFLTGGISVSIPGEGIKDAAGGGAPNWTGAFINVVINY